MVADFRRLVELRFLLARLCIPEMTMHFEIQRPETEPQKQVQHILKSFGCALSASLNRRPEDVRVLTIIVAKLELGNIERHIFGAYLVEAANDRAC